MVDPEIPLSGGVDNRSKFPVNPSASNLAKGFARIFREWVCTSYRIVYTPTTNALAEGSITICYISDINESAPATAVELAAQPISVSFPAR